MLATLHPFTVVWIASPSGDGDNGNTGSEQITHAMSTPPFEGDGWVPDQEDTGARATCTRVVGLESTVVPRPTRKSVLVTRGRPVALSSSTARRSRSAGRNRAIPSRR